MTRSPFRLATSPSTSSIVGAILLMMVAYVIALPPAVVSMSGIAVNSTADSIDAVPGDGTCADSLGRCTLRAAVMEANASAGAHTITMPAGTYTLTLGPYDNEFNFGEGATETSGDIDVQNNDLTITGAGSSATIIDGGAIDRVFDVNNAFGSGIAVNFTLQDLTVRNGNAPETPEGFFEAGGAIQFDGTNFSGPNTTLTLTNVRVLNSTAAGLGGGIFATSGSVNVSGSEISGNTTTNANGGGMVYDGPFTGTTLQLTNSTVSNNSAPNSTFGSGGGLWVGGGTTKNIRYNSITNNHAGATGGGVFNGNNSLSMNFNVIVGNTASGIGGASSTGFRNNLGTTAVDNNWWGCNQGPAVAPCDRASGPSGFGITQWLFLNHKATPNTILVNTATSLQADFYNNNTGTVILPTDLVALNGRSILFNNAVLGTISGADTQISNGKANATFTAGSTGGTGSADATVDYATVTALININQAPTVTVNPTDQTACDGGSVTFTAASSGVPPPTVQWQVSTGGPFTDIPGATSNTLTFTATSAEDGYQYRAVFTNAGGTDTTTAATLTVNSAPIVATNPGNVTVCEGATASFTASATGKPTPTVQWQVSIGGGPFTNLPGETNTTLSFTASTSQNGNKYRAVFTNSCGSANTTDATLTVNEAATTSDPADQTVCQGATAAFSTTAGGTGPFHYAWTVDGTAFGGDTSSINVPTGSLSVGNHTVAVSTTGACGSASQSATLTVNANTTTSDPPDVATCEGATASFTTNASGTAPFSFVWKQGAVPIVSGGRFTITNTSTSSTLTISNVQAGDAGTYTVETTGACGTATQSANLSVDSTPPTIILNGNTITLWPPNHQYHTINVTDLVSGVSDSCDSLSVSDVTIAGVTSDEVENSSGADGNTFNDIVISCNRHSVQLRAERDGDLDGRVYTITFTVTDSQGHVGTATAKVTVPVDQNGAAAVDSGPHYAVATATCP